ncbi:MAG: NifU family protein [Bacilli bacterium]
MEEVEKLVIETLDKLRHFLQKDGGDVEFIEFNDGIVYVTLHGACRDCAFADQDIKQLVEVILQEEVPGVVEVRMATQEQIDKHNNNK